MDWLGATSVSLSVRLEGSTVIVLGGLAVVIRR